MMQINRAAQLEQVFGEIEEAAARVAVGLPTSQNYAPVSLRRSLWHAESLSHRIVCLSFTELNQSDTAYSFASPRSRFPLDPADPLEPKSGSELD